MPLTTELRFRITVRTHEQTGLMVAISPDHKGLNVFGKSADEIRKRLPEAIRALLEAEGKHVIDVVAEPETAEVQGFDNPSIVAEAKLAA